VLPFARKVEAEFVARIDVGQVGRAGMECESRFYDMDVGRCPVRVLHSCTVGLARRGGLDRHDAVELTALDPSAGVGDC